MLAKVHSIQVNTIVDSLCFACSAIPGSRDLDVLNLEASFTQWPLYSHTLFLSKENLHWVHDGVCTFSHWRRRRTVDGKPQWVIQCSSGLLWRLLYCAIGSHSLLIDVTVWPVKRFPLHLCETCLFQMAELPPPANIHSVRHGSFFRNGTVSSGLSFPLWNFSLHTFKVNGKSPMDCYRCPTVHCGTERFTLVVQIL